MIRGDPGSCATNVSPIECSVPACVLASERGSSAGLSGSSRGPSAGISESVEVDDDVDLDEDDTVLSQHKRHKREQPMSNF